jgi:cold shock protein
LPSFFSWATHLFGVPFLVTSCPAHVKNSGNPNPQAFVTTFTGDLAVEPSNKVVEEKDSMAQYKGTVKWFNNAKGYGFLGRDDGADVFVHYSSIQLDGYKTLKEGDIVEFDVIQGSKGPQADQVSRIKEAL